MCIPNMLLDLLYKISTTYLKTISVYIIEHHDYGDIRYDISDKNTKWL